MTGPSDPSRGGLSRTSRVASLLRWFFAHLYTTIAWAYDAVAWLSSFGQWSRWRRTGLDRVSTGARWLEIGYGTGHLLREALARGDRAVGIDASRQMARITARRLRRFGLPAVAVRARLEGLPFPAGCFEAEVATFPSEVILDRAALREARRVLAPGARLTVVLMVHIRPRFVWERLTRLLYSLTGESRALEERWLAPFVEAGFGARFESVDVPGASVLHIVAEA